MEELSGVTAQGTDDVTKTGRADIRRQTNDDPARLNADPPAAALIIMLGRAGIAHDQLCKALFASRCQNQSPLARKAPPGCQVLRQQSMTTRNRAHLHARLEAFCNDLRLIRPVTPPRRSFKHLQPTNVTLNRSQQMLHSLFQRFAPNQNAKLAQTTPPENPSYRWGARTAYGLPADDVSQKEMAQNLRAKPSAGGHSRGCVQRRDQAGSKCRLTRGITNFWAYLRPACGSKT